MKEFHPSSLIPHPFLWRYAFCCTFPVLPRPGGRVGRWALPTTAPCGARTFLSPVAVTEPRLAGSDRPAGLQTPSLYHRDGPVRWQDGVHVFENGTVRRLQPPSHKLQPLTKPATTRTSLQPLAELTQKPRLVASPFSGVRATSGRVLFGAERRRTQATRPRAPRGSALGAGLQTPPQPRPQVSLDCLPLQPGAHDLLVHPAALRASRSLKRNANARAARPSPCGRVGMQEWGGVGRPPPSAWSTSRTRCQSLSPSPPLALTPLPTPHLPPTLSPSTPQVGGRPSRETCGRAFRRGRETRAERDGRVPAGSRDPRRARWPRSGGVGRPAPSARARWPEWPPRRRCAIEFSLGPASSSGRAGSCNGRSHAGKPSPAPTMPPRSTPWIDGIVAT